MSPVCVCTSGSQSELKIDRSLVVRSIDGLMNVGIFFLSEALPRMEAASPTRLHASIGREVRLPVASEKNLALSWMFEATEISQIPDDPSLAFQRDTRGEQVLQTLVITELEFRHYGLYSVEGEKDGCKERIQFDVRHAVGEWYRWNSHPRSSDVVISVLVVVTFTVVHLRRPRGRSWGGGQWGGRGGTGKEGEELFSFAPLSPRPLPPPPSFIWGFLHMPCQSDQPGRVFIWEI